MLFRHAAQTDANRPHTWVSESTHVRASHLHTSTCLHQGGISTHLVIAALAALRRLAALCLGRHAREAAKPGAAKGGRGAEDGGGRCRLHGGGARDRRRRRGRQRRQEAMPGALAAGLRRSLKPRCASGSGAAAGLALGRLQNLSDGGMLPGYGSGHAIAPMTCTLDPCLGILGSRHLGLLLLGGHSSGAACCGGWGCLRLPLSTVHQSRRLDRAAGRRRAQLGTHAVLHSRTCLLYGPIPAAVACPTLHRPLRSHGSRWRPARRVGAATDPLTKPLCAPCRPAMLSDPSCLVCSPDGGAGGPGLPPAGPTAQPGHQGGF